MPGPYHNARKVLRVGPTGKPLGTLRIDDPPSEAELPAQKPISRPAQDQKPKQRQEMPPRLPNGAVFWAQYSAERQEWTGNLTIPAENEKDHVKVFQADARAVFTLLPKLDRMYRNFLKSKANSE